MKRWLIGSFVVSYLTLLGYGLVAHVVGYERAAHAGMYFLVWDMYCGWNGFETRQHMIAEGESGTYYEITPSPWPELIPFGAVGRHDYDSGATHSGRLAGNVLRHTEHEPIQQVLVIEEAWAKKYNLPESLWAERYAEPREPYSYYHIHATYTPEGDCKSRFLEWSQQLNYDAIHANPRLHAEMGRSRPFMITNSQSKSTNVEPANYESSDE